NPTAEAAAHVSAPVPRISARGHGIPPEADAVFDRALAKRPADRFSSNGEFVAALRQAFDDAAGSTRVAFPPPRRRSGAWAALLVALLLAAGIAAAVLLGTRGHGT